MMLSRVSPPDILCFEDYSIPANNKITLECQPSFTSTIATTHWFQVYLFNGCNLPPKKGAYAEITNMQNFTKFYLRENLKVAIMATIMYRL